MTEFEAIIPASADDTDSAAFRSIESALRFAYGNRYRGKPDSLAQHQKRIAGRGGATRFESDEERAAMAGVIRRRISTLGELRVAILIVRYAPRSSPCSCRSACCSGEAFHDEWLEAAALVADRSIEAVPGTVSPRRFRAGIVQRWAKARRVNIGLLADQCGIHRNTAGSQAKAVRKWLDALLQRANDAADLALRA